MAEDKTAGRNLQKEVLNFVSQEIRYALEKVDRSQLSSMEEIRLRAGKPLIIQNSRGEWFTDGEGNLVTSSRNSYITGQQEIVKTLELMSENSVYAYQDEIRNGFITLKGGHRVGITGRTVCDGSAVKNIRDISGLNIRISREVRGCASGVARHVLKSSGEIFNTLIISPPQCGKTTMLRDLSRIISNGVVEYGFKGMKVGIVDERSELAACYKGMPQNDVGMRTDVLDACPKALGMLMMLRSMSPDVIVTDEIGCSGDKDAIMQVINAGIKIIATAHGYNISELKTRREVLNLLEERVFERFIVLSSSKGPGTIEEIIDGTTMKVVLKNAV